eukprot:10735638-Prorocentrum_lima.AAC.1
MTGGGQQQQPNTLAGVPFVRRVLVDTGANEIIRPHNADRWNEIMVKREEGQPVTLKLAGGGAMTQYGEVMPGSSDSDSKSDIGWIVPVCRLTKEL